jgi:virginiamycin B lyase
MVANKIGKLSGDQIIEYPTPTKFAAPFKCAVDQADNVWFTEVFGNAVGKLDTRSGEIIEYQIPTPDSRPGGIAVDHKGRIWFTEQKGNKIGVFDPVLADKTARPGAVTSAFSSPLSIHTPHHTDNAETKNAEEFQVPTPGAGPGGDLVQGSTGWLWFPEVYGNKLGAINSASKQFREVAIPTPFSMPIGVAETSDGVLWVPEFRGNRLARIDPHDSSVREFALQQPESLPAGVTVDQWDDVWLTQMAVGRIARFNKRSETFEQFAMPGGDVSPFLIAADRRGALWITASNRAGNYLARFDIASKHFETYPLPTPACGPAGILVDDGAVWVTESQGAKLAQFEIGQKRWNEFSVPVANSEPVRLTRDARGQIWVADGGGIGTAGGNSLDIFDPARGTFSVILMKSRKAKPAGVLQTADGSMWFTQMGANSVAYVSNDKGERL